MNFEALPGPTLPELARTALARAAAATVSPPLPGGGPSCLRPVPVRAGSLGSPVLLTATGSALERELAAGPGTITVSVPARAPYRALRLTGAAQPAGWPRTAEISAYTVIPRSVEFTGSTPARIPVGAYRQAAPDPLWREAPGVLRHLEHCHLSDLIGCVRAHGMPQADWVIPRGLDRFGLELLVLTGEGIAAVRLSFPDGPVTSLPDVPASIRAMLTCRCNAGSGHHRAPRR
jgi:hypothetical protein